jgi:hypothetical protein
MSRVRRTATMLAALADIEMTLRTRNRWAGAESSVGSLMKMVRLPRRPKDDLMPATENKGGRPPINGKAMTAAERMRRHRARIRAEKSPSCS